MKFVKSIMAVVSVLAMSLSACASKPASTPQTPTNEEMKSVIVYFTHSGNTELAAKEVAAVTGAKMIRLRPEQPYSSEDVDWVNEQSRCTQEHLNQSLRPAIKPVDINFADVDTVFVGFPIWWHEEPAVIRTFLDDYRAELKNKVIYPFCTSYESPMSEADATLRKGYPGLNIKTGLRLPAKPEQIKKWIEEYGS
ncbi:MAG: NAD(P)H-dependent oxidoreductase [Muribaculaceae bacterium]|nr:NAD(P)H-dependent oxidoreductase [Muribaculaceae bacterium]